MLQSQADTGVNARAVLVHGNGQANDGKKRKSNLQGESSMKTGPNCDSRRGKQKQRSDLLMPVNGCTFWLPDSLCVCVCVCVCVSLQWTGRQASIRVIARLESDTKCTREESQSGSIEQPKYHGQPDFPHPGQ